MKESNPQPVEYKTTALTIWANSALATHVGIEPNVDDVKSHFPTIRRMSRVSVVRHFPTTQNLKSKNQKTKIRN